MIKSINIMRNNICNILEDNSVTIYLYGSIVRQDFRFGWSDIDRLCLTEKSITKEQAEKLVDLRQALLIDSPNNKYFRVFEGGILTLEPFIEKNIDNVVYLGTSEQTITNNHKLNSLSMIDLIKNGKLINGLEIRNQFYNP